MTQRNLLYLSNLIGATACRYARIITPQFYRWTCPDPIFRQGRRARAKNLVSGDETRSTGTATWVGLWSRDNCWLGRRKEWSEALRRVVYLRTARSRRKKAKSRIV